MHKIRILLWVAFVLLPLTGGITAADEVPVRMPDRIQADLLGEGERLNDEIVDISVWEGGDVLLAVSKRAVYLLTLPKFQLLAKATIRGRGLNGGIVAKSDPDRIFFLVVSAFGKDVNTYFYEFRKSTGKIRRAGYDSSSFYRIADGMLYRQDVGRLMPFQGSVRAAAVEMDRHIRPVDRRVVDLPPRPRLYGFAMGRMWPDKIGVVRVEGDDRRLALYQQGDGEWEEVWQSEESFGGSLAAVRGSGQDKSEERHQGLVTAQLDDDPEVEILAVSNIPSAMVDQVFGRAYDRAKVRAFDIRGRGAALLWETDSLRGTIPNIAVWRGKWILPLVNPQGKATRFYVNSLKPAGVAPSR